ncbi:MAG: MAPEG family protein [Acidobacteria bacterium]|nr:MAPEG family protein [Acidobacteriota bacterium]MCB9399018.1 MAPEG family protein [Acidobacteriota bacterium]
MDRSLVWLFYYSALVVVMWVPYILNAFIVRGILPTLGNPQPDAKPLSPWAQRAKLAHANAIENLVPFLALMFLAHVTSAPVAGAAAVFFFARLAHFIVYTLGIPYLRTLSFLAGFGAQVAIALQLLQHV